MNNSNISLSKGVEIIKQFQANLPALPGVYRMLDDKADVLYVGKAKNLAKRVQSYTHPVRLPYRTQRMIAQTVSMEMTQTTTEAEALLLEANLIKKLQPRYNILLKDDKSFPYIIITGDHPFGRIVKHRGAQNKKHRYFGPYASAGDVNRTLDYLQRIFLLRPCTDSYFANRTRPCLEYQIKRCSAPCVDKISEKDYKALVAQAVDFLSGKSSLVQKQLATQMEEASEKLEYEKAAFLRDRLQALTKIQASQMINVASVMDADVIALHRSVEVSSIQVVFFRGGQHCGNKAYFPSHSEENSDEDILEAFIGQFYQNHPIPDQLLLSHTINNKNAMQEALLNLRAQSIKQAKKVSINYPKRGDKATLMEHAINNAKQALAQHLAEHEKFSTLLESVGELFAATRPVQRIEVYDNSHIMGTNEMGAMIVAGKEGFIKKEYRKYTIRSTGKDIKHGDDYAMMQEMLTRRLTQLQQASSEYKAELWPDIMLIDGGAGHLSSAMEIVNQFGMADEIAVVAISKGPDRNAGKERFHLPHKESFTLKPHDPVMHYLQNLRDEAHRFAIGSHRSKRGKSMARSVLDEIPSIGAARKKALLTHFGSAAAIAQASVEDLKKVEGISQAMAQRIYEYFK